MLILSLNYISAQEIKDFVNDYVHILNETEKQEITQIAQSIYDSGAAEYAIMIINSTQGKSIEDYAINIAQGKLGSEEKDNGLLLLIATQDREYRFEVGSGLEGILNDAKIGRISRDYLVPNFKQQQYGKGIIEASTAIKNTLNQTNDQRTTNQNNSIYPLIVLIILIVIFLSFIIFNIIKYSKKKNKHFKAARNASILFGPTIFGGKGSGGSSGGFGGFGGGGFSGGGSSGHW
jgi:uncharacterized protein